MDKDQIQPIDIEFDDIISPQPVREEPVKEEPIKTEEPAADIVPADIDTEEEKKEVEEKVAQEKSEEVPVAETEPSPEPVAEESTEDDSTVVGEILQKFGYDDIDEEFEDTTEGLAKLTHVLSEKLAVETLDNLFEKFPTVQKHLEYVQQGGDPNTFMKAFAPEVDYSNIDIKDEDSDLQKKILYDYFVAKGTEENFIGDMIESYEDKGILKDKAEAAKKALSDAQAGQREAELARQKEVAEAHRKETEEMWRSVATTIHDNNDLAGIPISQREKAKFFEYISKPVNAEGLTQRDLDFQKAGLDQKLAVDYMVYKGFDIGKFIGTKATTKAAKSLKTKLENHSKKAKSVRTNYNNSSSPDLESLDLNFSNLGG